MKTVVYQGVEGSYSHMTALRLFGTSVRLIGLPQFANVIEAVEKDQADYALLAVENTLIGPIYEVLDLLGESSLLVQAETSTRIEHCLLSLPEGTLEEIKTVYSHSKALGQCLNLFKQYPFLIPEVYIDTAAAANFVAQKKDPSCAAIASRLAASLYGLKVLLPNIEDHAANFTRFFVLGKEENEGCKCTIRITLRHEIGALAPILSLIAKEQVNLTSIISRPLMGRPFEYAFYLDLEQPGKALLEEIQKKAEAFRNFGCYSEWKGDA